LTGFIPVGVDAAMPLDHGPMGMLFGSPIVPARGHEVVAGYMLL
jgi:hypothetical protein